MTKERTYENPEELNRSISQGVSSDNINLRTVTFWMVLGILMITVILYGLYNMYTYNQFLSSQQAAINAEYHELNWKREREQEKLNSFELIDEESRRYRIPIDSAMTIIVTQRN